MKHGGHGAWWVLTEGLWLGPLLKYPMEAKEHHTVLEDMRVGLPGLNVDVILWLDGRF